MEDIEKPFSVVVWPDGGICIVATKWMNKCKESVVYPTKNKCPTKLVMSLTNAQEDWKECNVEFLHSYKTYNLARKAAVLAVEDQPIDSNIETDYDKQRKRQLPTRFTQSSDDDDSEPETMYTKRKRQVTGGSHREMQRTENEERKNCQDVSQVNSIPAPAINIREQLAALRAQVFDFKKLKSNESHLNLKKKVLCVKKYSKAVNNKVSSRKSPPKEIINYQKNPADTENTNAIDLPQGWERIIPYESYIGILRIILSMIRALVSYICSCY